jgi:hypothetical protein
MKRRHALQLGFAALLGAAHPEAGLFAAPCFCAAVTIPRIS